MPMVSVVMPVYNAQRYLAEATESILGQDFDDFEFIIINDGSTDGSRAILERYAALDARIRIVSRPNTGIVQALNEGLGLARAELIARMDSDDISEPDRLGRQVRYMDENPSCVCAGSRVTIIDPVGRPLKVMTDFLTHEQIEGALLAGTGSALYHPSVMFRKSVVLGIGGYRPIFDESEDLDLFLRLAEVGRVANIEKPLLRYREHMSKASKTKVIRVVDNARRILEDAYRRRGLVKPPGLAEAVPPAFEIGEVHRNWGWWALGSGHVATARKYAMTSLLRTPFTFDSWRLLLCAIRGR